MKIIVFSDSHRDIEPMADVLKALKPDMVIHLGDHIYDAAEIEKLFPEIPMESVKGNCDLGSQLSSFKLLDIEGYSIFITHGDRFGVRSGTSGLVAEGRKRNADLILFGHTHRPVVKKKKGMVLMNPGSIGRFSRGSSEPSFGIIETDGGLKCHTLDYDNLMESKT